MNSHLQVDVRRSGAAAVKLNYSLGASFVQGSRGIRADEPMNFYLCNDRHWPPLDAVSKERRLAASM